MHFGATFADAKKRATARIEAIKAAIHALGALPHRGTRRDNLMRGMRSVTKQRAILYFTVDEEQRVVRVLAVFFGGQDHQNIMLRRLLERN